MENKKFILAGKAIFTVTSAATGARFTYKVNKKKGSEFGPYFVSLLTGPDNESNYEFFGTVFDPQAASIFRASPRSRITTKNAEGEFNSPGVRAFDWLWRNIDKPEKMARVSICHCGRCGRCGRLLTVPSSVESGFGPECINLV